MQAGKEGGAVGAETVRKQDEKRLDECRKALKVLGGYKETNNEVKDEQLFNRLYRPTAVRLLGKPDRKITDHALGTIIGFIQSFPRGLYLDVEVNVGTITEQTAICYFLFGDNQIDVAQFGLSPQAKSAAIAFVYNRIRYLVTGIDNYQVIKSMSELPEFQEVMNLSIAQFKALTANLKPEFITASSHSTLVDQFALCQQRNALQNIFNWIVTSKGDGGGRSAQEKQLRKELARKYLAVILGKDPAQITDKDFSVVIYLSKYALTIDLTLEHNVDALVHQARLYYNIFCANHAGTKFVNNIEYRTAIVDFVNIRMKSFIYTNNAKIEAAILDTKGGQHYHYLMNIDDGTFAELITLMPTNYIQPLIEIFKKEKAEYKACNDKLISDVIADLQKEGRQKSHEKAIRFFIKVSKNSLCDTNTAEKKEHAKVLVDNDSDETVRLLEDFFRELKPIKSMNDFNRLLQVSRKDQLLSRLMDSIKLFVAESDPDMRPAIVLAQNHEIGYKLGSQRLMESFRRYAQENGIVAKS